jgi:hypothetical protein
MGLLLLTPKSLTSKWIMCEAGALWVLDKPIITAWKYIGLRDLPEVMTMYQTRQLETHEDQTALVAELEHLLRDPVPKS